MKKLLNLILLISAASFLLSSSGLAQKSPKELKFPPLKEIKIPEIKKVTLQNGMRLLLIEDHSFPLIEASAMIKIGSKYEPADKVGLAAITGAVLRTGGTQTKAGDQIDEELESIGASVETWIERSSGGAYLSVLKEDIDKGLSTLADILMNPLFHQDKIELSKVQHKSMISRRNDDPMGLTTREFIRLVYGKDHPYGRIEEYETLNNITRKDLVEFHKRYFYPNNVILALWGDFKTKDITSKVKQAFKDWKEAKITFPPEPKVSKELIPSVNLINKDDVNQTNINIGHLGGRMDNPDYPALTVLTEILGGGFSSRLFRSVRSDQGLAYAVWGFYGANFDYPSVLYNGCSTKSETTYQAISSIIKEIKEITENEVSDEELKTAKDGILNSFVFRFDTKREVIQRLMTYEYFGYPEDFLQKYKKSVENVTKADILRAAKTHIHPNRLIILAVGKSQGFDKPLTEFGTVNEIDITIPQPASEAGKLPKPTELQIAKGKEIINASIDAYGGLANIKEINNMTLVQETTIVTPQGEFKIESTDTYVFPDKVRSELKMPFGEMIMVLDGENGWMKGPQGIQDLPKSQLEAMKKSLKRNTLLLFQSLQKEGTILQALDPEEIEGQEVDIVYITDAEGNVTKFAISPETHLIVQKSYQGQTMMGPAQLEEIFSDYQDISGIKIAYHSIVNADGKKFTETKVIEAKTNTEIPEPLFKKPEKEE